jgi:cell wall-associated NlpC family hydrolase
MRELIGIPWREYGHDLDGCDCLGLVLLAQERLFGRAVPCKTEWFAPGSESYAEHSVRTCQSFMEYLRPAREMVPGVIMGFRLSNGYVHAATCVEGGRILHIFEGGRSRVSELTGTLRRCLFGLFGLKVLREGGDGEWV